MKKIVKVTTTDFATVEIVVKDLKGTNNDLGAVEYTLTIPKANWDALAALDSATPGDTVSESITSTFL